ncbi:flagellar export chaperone FliS [Salinisphaera sp. Q1T1-3]|uniref:flagellar export chaperone FliS n=1 Tax=Salinisphaera sp. Q1T1-3 TaxID=2321229 RepID=UPI000E715B45|nr:flagellar export chaperone FliS [Salinisphaera sp. Q1T1-3]RJS95195.1 flagella export chaperone FliS [Salinisphaera sp. Q1T1-3]
MNTQQAARAYANVGLSSGAMSASPHQLIVMLFDGAQGALRKAEYALSVGDVGGRGSALSKAIDIIERGLRAALDMERGGTLAERLDALYDYMIRRLMQANLRGDAEAISEVARLLEEIGSAWKQIG